MKQIVLLFFASLLTLQVKSQNDYQKRALIETQIQEMCALDSFNIARIADTITAPFSDKIDKAFAIYYWISNNISLDPKSVKKNDSKKIDPVSVIQLRKTNAFGFATLFQEMCSMADIRCLVVNGYTKYNYNDINNPPDEPNHSWNVVQTGQSPDQWYYVDVAKASGNLDIRFTTFKKKYCRGYFFADRKIFNLDHLPENKAWLLGFGPKNKNEFYLLPVIESGAYILGAYNPAPFYGFIKTKTSKAFQFSFKIKPGTSISRLMFITKEGNKPEKKEPLIYEESEGTITIRYTFKKEETYVVRFNADENDLFTYLIESSE